MFTFVDVCVCLVAHLHTFKLLVISVLCACSHWKNGKHFSSSFFSPLSGPLALAFM